MVHPFRLLVFAVAVVSGLSGCESPQAAGRVETDGESEGAFVWRGFEHRWTYNHRLNRLGDYLQHRGCSTESSSELPRLRCRGTLHHTGASGTGADRLEFVSRYSEVGTTAASFHPVTTVLHFQGREERELRREQVVEVPVDQKDGGRTYAAVLNGYDLRTDGGRKAKKVKRFRLRIGDRPQYDPEEGHVEFSVRGLLDVNCDSVECKTQRNRVHYRLEARALLVHAGEMRTTARRFETFYQWDKRNELDVSKIALNRKRQSIQGRAGRYDVGFLGFQEIDFNLSKKGRYKDHWFVAWGHAIDDVDYRSAGGRASFDLDLFFKEWNARTKRKTTSIARPGEANLVGEVALIQLEDGRTGHESVTGTLEWPGRNRPPDSPAAEWKKRLQFEF